MGTSELEIKRAESWFVLAQILMILSGFLFASSGLFFDNAQKNLDSAISIDSNSLDTLNFMVENNDSIKEQNLTKTYQNVLTNLANDRETFGELGLLEIDLFKSLLYIASLIAVFSIIVFFWGRYQISRIKINN